jgi:type IV secretion system protein VirB1
MIDTAFYLQCAPTVAPSTMEAVVRVESNGDPLALYINGLGAIHVTSIAAGAARVRQAIAAGYTVDIGLTGLNSRTLDKYHVPIEAAFDRCTNVGIGAAVLTENYVAAVKRYGPGQIAIEAALSAYNTGDFWRGRENGYLAGYFGLIKVPGRKRVPPSPYSVASIAYTTEVAQ